MKPGFEKHAYHSAPFWCILSFGPAFVLLFVVSAFGPGASEAGATQPLRSPHPVARVVELKASDGTLLKASYFAAAKPGPGVLLLHQFNRTRKSWDEVAAQLAAAGIHTLTLDLRGYGESGGTPHEKLTPKERAEARERRPDDIDTAWQYLTTQPGVNKDAIGLGGAGALGVDNSTEAARRHSSEVKSLALLSGYTSLRGRQFIQQASQLPGLFVWADGDEYPPTAEVMEWLCDLSSSANKMFVRYVGQKAPWNGYESGDGLPPIGAHGTDLFKGHPELPHTIVDWFITTLIKAPGHAAIETTTVAGQLSAPLLIQIDTPGGAAHAAHQLAEARRRDPKTQLWPWVVLNVLGYDHLDAGETQLALEIFKLNVAAYPESADAYGGLSDAYLADGQKDLARQAAEKTLALLDSNTNHSDNDLENDTQARRKVVRDGALDNLKQLAQTKTN